MAREADNAPISGKQAHNQAQTETGSRKKRPSLRLRSRDARVVSPEECELDKFGYAVVFLEPRAWEQMQVQTTFFKKLFSLSLGSRTQQHATGVGGPAHMRSLLESREAMRACERNP